MDICRAIGELPIAGEVGYTGREIANVIKGLGVNVLGVLRGKNEARVSRCTSTCGRRLDMAAAATGGAIPG